MATLQLRRGTAANAAANNAVLAAGEPGLETDTGKLKVGDGVTAYAALAYAVNELTRSGVKTTAYAAKPGDLVPTDISGGTVAHALPSAPPDRTRIAFKVVAVSGTPGSTSMTITAGGTDCFNLIGGSTVLTISALFQGVILQYDRGTGVWSVTTSDTPLGSALGAAMLGTDGTIGGPGGSQLSQSVVNAVSLYEFNVAAFGFDAQGNDVNTTPWNNLIAYISSLVEPGRTAHIRGVKIVFPRGEFCLNNCSLSTSQLGWNGKIIIEGQGDQTRIFPGGSQGQALTIVGGPSPQDAVALRDFRIGYGSEVLSQPDLPYNQPIVTIRQSLSYELSGLTGFLSTTGTLIHLDSAYNGVVRSCFFQTGLYGVPIRWDNASFSTDNDTISFRDVVMTGQYGVVMDFYGYVETIHLDEYKQASGDPSPGGASVNHAESYLASASAAAASTITLNPGDGSMFAANDSIAIGEGDNGLASGYGFEVNKIVSISTDTLTLKWPLQFTHDPAGHHVQVIRGGIGFVAPGGARFLKISSSHFEHTAIGVHYWRGTVIELDHVTSTCLSLLRVGGGSTAAGGAVDILLGAVESSGDAIVGGGNQNVLVDIPSWVPTTGGGSVARPMIDGPLINSGSYQMVVNYNGTLYNVDEFGYLTLTLATGFAQGTYQAFGVKLGRTGLKMKGFLTMAGTITAQSPIFTLPPIMVPKRSALVNVFQTNAQNFTAVPAANWLRIRGSDQTNPGEVDLQLATTAAGWVDLASSPSIAVHS